MRNAECEMRHEYKRKGAKVQRAQRNSSIARAFCLGVAFLLAFGLSMPGYAAGAKKAGGKKKAGAAQAAAAKANPWAALLPQPGAEKISSDESVLIGVLQSTTTLARKDAACAGLKRVGTAKCVAALAALLTDENLSHAARYALESLPGPEAGKTLIGALDKTRGLMQAGIMQTLGQRREAAAVRAIAFYLTEADPIVAEAAAHALGCIGNDEALNILNSAYQAGRITAQTAPLAEALMMVAEQRNKAGDKVAAGSIYRGLISVNPKQAPVLTTAAVRGYILSMESSRDATARLTWAIGSQEKSIRNAGLQLAREIGNSETTKKISDLLPALDPAVQVALIEALRQRGDASAAEAIKKYAAEPDSEVRAAACRALGALGDQACLDTLAQAAASRDEAVKKAARQALLEINRGEISEGMVKALAAGEPSTAAEMVRALTGRGDRAAAGKLIELAGSEEASAAARKAALTAAGQLAGSSHVNQIVELVTGAQDKASREAAAEALRSVLRRVLGQGAAVDAEPILAAMKKEKPGVRATLLTAASALNDARVREAVRKALNRDNPKMREAALHALAETSDGELLPDLIAEANGADDAAQRVALVRGAVRLATEEAGTSLSAAQRVGALKQLINRQNGQNGQGLSKEEKWLVLSGLARVKDLAALELAVPMIEDPATRPEAVQAVTAIAGTIQTSHPEPARAALRKALAAAADPAQKKAAGEALGQLDALAGFITGWEATGPFTQGGKGATELFDVAFAPEKEGAPGVTWARLPAGTLAGRPNVLDLFKPLGGGGSRVAYARTRIFSEKAQPARVELGYDDGIKAWFNGTLIHSQNYIGALQPAAGKAEIELKQGWNTLLLKITQNSMMWEFCARLVSRDGAPLEGVRVDEALGGGKILAPAPTPKPVAAPAAPSPVVFRKQQLDPVFRSEGVGVADFNKDGKMDICTGNMIYLGPDWKATPMLGEPKEYKPEGYSQEFYCFPEDVDQDGWVDAIVVGFPGMATRWLRNPGAAGGVWQAHLAIAKTGNESPDWLDVDQDGKKEMVFIGAKGMALARPGRNVTQPWDVEFIADVKDPRPGHGIGVGDINGDKRLDVLCHNGWWEAPADRRQTPWPFHAVQFGEVPPAQMCVDDFDGDGDADVLTSGAHKYGMWWFEQNAGEWTGHEIDHTISQLHALHLADVDGDGLKDIVTGKRFWAHMKGDDGIDDPAVLCWFRLQRKDSKPAWTRHDLDQNSGVGLHVQIVDINGDGKVDIAASHKKGVWVFVQ